MDIIDGDDYLPLPPEEEGDGGDYYMHLDEDDDIHESIRPDDFVPFPLRVDLTGNIPADLIEQDPAVTTGNIIAGVGVMGASDDSQLALALSEALKTVEAPCDDNGHGCPICLGDDDAAVWKETPCGHRFHGRCVERWLHAKGSCPMCRRLLLTVDGTNTAMFREFMVIFNLYGRDAGRAALQMVISYANDHGIDV